MIKRAGCLLLLTAAVMIVSTSGCSNSQARFDGGKDSRISLPLRVAVVSSTYDDDEDSAWLADLAATRLHCRLGKSGVFDLYERHRLGELLIEQDLQASDLVDSNTASSFGKLVGVPYVLIARVTMVGSVETKVNILGARSKSAGRNCVLEARIVDVETGRVLITCEAEGECTSSSGSFLGFGSGHSKKDSLIECAIAEASRKLAKHCAKAVKKQARRR